MENNFTTQLSDNGASAQIRAGYIDYSDAIDPVTQAKERLAKRRKAAREQKIKDTMDVPAHYVKQKPLMSIGMAAGLGVVLGLLLKRR